MATFINPFTDFGFKRIFGQEAHKKLLIGFLNALFDGEFVVKDLVYRDKEQPGETQKSRGVIFDIYCTLADGKHFVVEMQNKMHVHFDARALYYLAKAIVAQGKKGGLWHYEYAPVFGVYFMNYCEEALGKAFCVDFGITRIRELFDSDATNTKHKTMLQTAGDQPKPFANKLRMIFLQMPRFTKTQSECKSDLDRWIYIMNHLNHLDSIPWEGKGEVWDELADASKVAALTPEERFAYDEELRNLWDLQATNAATIHNTIREMAQKMLAKGLDTALIAEISGLSMNEIEKLK